MSAEGTPLPRAAGVRPIRPAWSLAAGWNVTPRVGPGSATVAILAVTGLLLWSERVWPYERDSVIGPMLVLLALPAWIGARLAIGALRRQVTERRARRRLDGSPRWRDRDWSPSGVERSVGDGIQGIRGFVAWATPLCFALFLLCFALCARPGNWRDADNLGWVSTHWSVAVATYVLPVAFLALVVIPRIRRGRLVVSWPTFPQFTGGRCAFELRTTSTRARIDGVRVFLRCVQKRRRSIPILPGWRDRLVWVAEARLPLNARVGVDETQRADFDVPASAPSTDLRAADAVRWELLVLGTVGATDYADAVVVPVYAAR